MSEENPTNRPAPAPTPAPAQPAVKIELSKDLPVTYANMAVVTHTASEIVIDLAQLMPNVPVAKVGARVVMTPMNAKLLMRVLIENLGKFEAMNGEIRMPPGYSGLADQLFRPHHPPKNDPGTGNN
ncbi:MAG TPA: DUF3467 domain-containing protein [Anaerolineales bacterium]|nr:DUF3467 domain-containing protein [Anaerolineales bacterium]